MKLLILTQKVDSNDPILGIFPSLGLPSEIAQDFFLCTTYTF
jgi:hypothetical protein